MLVLTPMRFWLEPRGIRIHFFCLPERGVVVSDDEKHDGESIRYYFWPVLGKILDEMYWAGCICGVLQ